MEMDDGGEMERNVKLKIIEKREILLTQDPHDLYCTNDGDILYWNTKRPTQFFVRLYSGQEMHSNLNSCKVYGFHNNEVFFRQGFLVNFSIHAAKFSLSRGVTIRKIKNQDENETFHDGALCSRVRFGKTYVYRMWEDPIRDAILVDASCDELKDLVLIGIHRGNAFYYRHELALRFPAFTRLGENVIIVTWKKLDITIYSDERNDQFVFFSAMMYDNLFPFIFVLTLETLTFTNLLEIGDDVTWIKVCGIHDGIATIYATNEGEDNPFIVQARIPEAFLPYLKSKDTQDIKQEQSRYGDDFLFRRNIGEGQFGKVEHVVKKHDRADYALKIIKLKEREERDEREKQLNEVRAMQNLNHVGIVQYYDCWIEKSRYDGLDSLFIQMELCKYSLHDWLDKNQVQSSRKLTRMKSWFKQILNAVQYMHGKNVLHRDIKPENILFASEDTLKIGDLGIATDISGEKDVNMTMTRTRVGTPIYMSPEIKLSSFIYYSAKSDVFSLGLIFAEMTLVMTPKDRDTIFENYRQGIPQESFAVWNTETERFVGMLANSISNRRPSCTEILKDPYLANC